MIGNVEDEWCFFRLSTFMKSKLCNKLIDHLYLITHMFVQKFFTLESFSLSWSHSCMEKIKKWYVYNIWVIIEVWWCCVDCGDYFLQIGLVTWWLCFRLYVNRRWYVLLTSTLTTRSCLLQGSKLIATCWNYVSQAMMDHGICNLGFGLCRKWTQHGRGCKPRLRWRVVLNLISVALVMFFY
jgi:hypothetical protein